MDVEGVEFDLVPQLLRDGAKQAAILRLIRGHDRKATLALFQLRDRRGNGTVRRRDMLRVLASPVLDLRFTKAERGLVADRYQLSETKRCVYEGLVDALHRRPRGQHTLHFGGKYDSNLLIPFVPGKE